IAVFMIYKRINYGLAFIMIMLQYGFAFFGYGISKMPYILYPYVEINTSVVNDAMALSLTVVFILGLFMLIPTLGLLLRRHLFGTDAVEGRESKKYEGSPN